MISPSSARRPAHDMDLGEGHFEVVDEIGPVLARSDLVEADMPAAVGASARAAVGAAVGPTAAKGRRRSVGLGADRGRRYHPPTPTTLAIGPVTLTMALAAPTSTGAAAR